MILSDEGFDAIQALSFKGKRLTLHLAVLNIVQAIASIIVVIIATTSNFNINSSILLDQNILLIIRLAIKAGVAPFQFWFPQIIAYAD